MNSNQRLNMVMGPANNAGLDGYDGSVINQGKNNMQKGKKYCDVMWASQLAQGQAQSFQDFVGENCVYKVPTVVNGIVYPPGALKYDMANSRIRNYMTTYPNPVFPAPGVPLMSHALNASALALAKSGAIPNDGKLSVAARQYGSLKNSVRNIMGTMM